MKYMHYVLTRFNIRINYEYIKNPKNSPLLKILDEDYLEERFDIFEKYTLPSMKNQTNQNFKWLIFFHKRTPKKFLNRIKKLKKFYNFEDLYFDDGEKFRLLDYRVKNKDYSDFHITTRIDNDDIIDEDYIKKIQDYANNNLHECFISFPHGLKFDLNFNKEVDFYSKFNHFTSMISSEDKTILNFNHITINNQDIETICFETEKPMWTEIIHSSNVLNEITEGDILNNSSKYDNLEKNEDLAIYQLISLKNRLNMEYADFLNKNITIGEYTYGKPKIINYAGNIKLNIGKFCSIDSNVTIILGGEHNPNLVTTYPFNFLVNEFNNLKGHPKIKGDINIGNDVWIHHGAVILSGVTIGDGAIIGANAVVTNDVPNYAIVEGNPARITCYRFDNEIIRKLEKIKWWDLKEDNLVKIIPFLQSEDMEKFLKEFKKIV